MTNTIISSGVTSSGLTISGAGNILTVLNGGKIVNATVLNGGAVLVSSGGSASATVVSSGGRQTVFSGGVEVSAFLSSGGADFVSSGGVADNTMIISGGTETVSLGGVASGAIVSGGDTTLSGGGTASTSGGGTQIVTSGGMALGTVLLSGGREVVSSGGVASGAVVSKGGAEYVSSGGVGVASVLSNGGREIVYSGGVTNAVVVSAGGAEYVSGGITNGTVVDAAGKEVVSSGVVNGTLVQSGGQEIVSSGSVANGSVDSQGSTETVFSGGVENGAHLLAGGTLDERAFAYAPGGTANFNSATDVLTVNQGGETYTQSLSGDYTGETFLLSADGAGGTDIMVQPACFYRGTRIATADGDIAVEDITAGTLVKTASGECKPVRWLGRSEVSTRFADPLRFLPIRIKAGALGDHLPLRDLLVSSDHAVFLEGMLVQAGALVNGVSILRETNVPETFTYYHVELADHDLLLAEGSATESFVDNVDRMNFSNWAEHEALGVLAPIAEMSYPRVKSHRQTPMALRQMLEASVEKVLAAQVA